MLRLLLRYIGATALQRPLLRELTIDRSGGPGVSNWQLEENTDAWLLEDGSGVWLLE